MSWGLTAEKARRIANQQTQVASAVDFQLNFIQQEITHHASSGRLFATIELTIPHNISSETDEIINAIENQL